MSLKFLAVRPLALASFVALTTMGSAAQATIVTFTSAAGFAAATTAQGTDTFAGLSVVSTTPSPLPRSTSIGAVYNYLATASTSSFFGSGTAGNPALSTNISNDSILLNTFSPGVSAIGANFFDSDIDGLFTSGDLVLTATDSTGSLVYAVVGPTQSSFVGFITDNSFVSLEIASITPNGAGEDAWPSVDNLTLAQALPVPEPETYALLLSGLAFVGFLARRRASNSAD